MIVCVWMDISELIIILFNNICKCSINLNSRKDRNMPTLALTTGKVKEFERSTKRIKTEQASALTSRLQAERSMEEERALLCGEENSLHEELQQVKMELKSKSTEYISLLKKRGEIAEKISLLRLDRVKNLEALLLAFKSINNSIYT